MSVDGSGYPGMCVFDPRIMAHVISSDPRGPSDARDMLPVCHDMHRITCRYPHPGLNNL